jgi:hypothetical protein
MMFLIPSDISFKNRLRKSLQQAGQRLLHFAFGNPRIVTTELRAK